METTENSACVAAIYEKGAIPVPSGQGKSVERQKRFADAQKGGAQ